MFPFLVLPSKSSLKSSLLAVLSASALLSAGAMAQGGPLRTGVDATFAPHAMVKLGGGLQGFNIDLGEELARRLGRKIEIEGTEFSGLVPGLNAKKYDFVLAPVTATPSAPRPCFHRRLPGYRLHLRHQEGRCAHQCAGRPEGQDHLGQQGLGL
jgi:hypothetical protein